MSASPLSGLRTIHAAVLRSPQRTMNVCLLFASVNRHTRVHNEHKSLASAPSHSTYTWLHLPTGRNSTFAIIMRDTFKPDCGRCFRLALFSFFFSFYAMPYSFAHRQTHNHTSHHAYIFFLSHTLSLSPRFSYLTRDLFFLFFLSFCFLFLNLMYHFIIVE